MEYVIYHRIKLSKYLVGDHEIFAPYLAYCGEGAQPDVISTSSHYELVAYDEEKITATWTIVVVETPGEDSCLLLVGDDEDNFRRYRIGKASQYVEAISNLLNIPKPLVSLCDETEWTASVTVGLKAAAGV